MSRCPSAPSAPQAIADHAINLANTVQGNLARSLESLGVVRHSSAAAAPCFDHARGAAHGCNWRAPQECMPCQRPPPATFWLPQTILKGQAKLTGPHTISYGLPGRVDVGGTATARDIIIATGSVPFVPGGIEVRCEDCKVGGCWWGVGCRGRQEQAGGCNCACCLLLYGGDFSSCPPACLPLQVDGKTVFTSDHALKMEWLPNWWVALRCCRVECGVQLAADLMCNDKASAAVLTCLLALFLPSLAQDCHHRLRLHRPRVLRCLHCPGLRGALGGMGAVVVHIAQACHWRGTAGEAAVRCSSVGRLATAR